MIVVGDGGAGAGGVVVMMTMMEREKEDPSKSFHAGLTTCTGR